MRRIRSIAASSALVVALVVPLGAASAATADECAAQIDQLRGQVAIASFVNAKDRSTVESKLAAAQHKLLIGKDADAVAKLVDFRSRVEVLGTTGKLGADEATALVAGAGGAIACIESIGSDASAGPDA